MDASGVCTYVGVCDSICKEACVCKQVHTKGHMKVCMQVVYVRVCLHVKWV